MADLSFIEKKNLEALLGMSTGYVMDFSDRTFKDFIGELIGVDIFDKKYDFASGSKANRMRAFWKVEPNYNVGILLDKLLEYWTSLAQTGSISYSESDIELHKECVKIATRLKLDGPVENLDALQANSDDKDFNTLAKAIRESIEKNEPENALDRLHTFVVKYTRQLSEKHSIPYDKETPLHSLFGGYVKHLSTTGQIESAMTERILKSSISVMEAFNEVRNNRSFAHDNPILNYNESLLIFNDVANVIRFIESIELQQKMDSANNESQEIDLENLPF
tara:strand:+ start:135 stop:968 length:834 start_codon:yes stop_codon:yes gene_type:complete